MTVAILQIVLSLLAGFLVFRLWRRVSAVSRPVFWLVTIGTLVRAVGGQLGFWISYLRMPVGRSMQLGRGLWFFGLDATTYFDLAANAAFHGPRAILFFDKTAPSPFFVQVLAAAVLLFGAVTSVAILLNVAAYLAGCRVLLSFGNPDEHRSIVFAIAALSLAPSAIVWSLQPMKDVSFFFLIIAFFGSARLWQQLWGEARASWLPASATVWSVVMAAMLYGISGIRWYFGFVVLMACMPFLLLTIVRAPRRLAVTAGAAALFVLLCAAFLTGAQTYIPPSLRAIFFHGDLHEVVKLPRTMLTYIQQSRQGFDRNGGATLIGAGSAIRRLDATLGAKEAHVVAAPLPLRQPQIAAGHVSPAQVSPKTTTPKTAAPAATPASLPAAPPAARPIRPSAIAHAAPAAARKAPGSAGIVLMPGSTAGRLLAGVAAVVLPQSVARWIGVIDVRGGRGLWLFVEIDTIVFDLVLAFAILSVIRSARRGALRAPVFWMILIVTVTIGVSLVYTVSNFGTLFRHRDMFLLGLALLPVAAAGSAPANGETAEEQPRLAGAPV